MPSSVGSRIGTCLVTRVRASNTPSYQKTARLAGVSKLADKKSQLAKTALKSESPGGTLAKGMVIHGVPCHRPMAEIV